jgi:hypothetical protein
MSEVAEQSVAEAPELTQETTAVDTALASTTGETSEVDEQVATEVTEAELVEIERNGKKHKIPKELEAELLMQADYTRKAQELAENRRALESHRDLFQQAVAIQRQHQQVFAQAAATAAELQKYANVDWNALTQADPGQAQQAFIRYQQLRDNFGMQSQALSRAEADFNQAQQAQQAAVLTKAQQQLARDLPEYTKPGTAAKLTEQGQKLGASEQELAVVSQPWVVKALWKAAQYDALVNKATAKPEAKPAPVASTVQARSAPRSLDSVSSINDWMKTRQAQLNKR